MPASRPYASRGVPRRATTRPPRHTASVVGLALVGAALALVVVGIGVASTFFVGGQHAPAAAVASAPGAADAVASTPGAAELRLTDLNASAARADLVSPAATPTTLALLRRWDATASGISVDPVLVGRLDQALVGVEGHVSVAVKNLGSGHGAVLDGDQELAAASLYKLPVLYTVFDSGVSLGEHLPITEQALAYDSGSMELGPGETLTVAEAVERMVALSDNTSAVMLGDLVGSASVNASIAALGMDTTHYSLERMTTSALDMLHLLDLVARGKAVSSAASADMLHLLLRQRVNDRLPRLLPDEAQVAHKTGNLPGTVNDVGIIYGPSSTVAIAALVSDTPDETAAAIGIARVALAAYSYFEEQPEDANRPLIPSPPARPIPPVRRVPRPVPTPTPTFEPRAGSSTQAPGTDPNATPAGQTTAPPIEGPGSPAAPIPTTHSTPPPTSVEATAGSASASPTVTGIQPVGSLPPGAQTAEPTSTLQQSTPVPAPSNPAPAPVTGASAPVTGASAPATLSAITPPLPAAATAFARPPASTPTPPPPTPAATRPPQVASTNTPVKH